LSWAAEHEVNVSKHSPTSPIRAALARSLRDTSRTTPHTRPEAEIRAIFARSGRQQLERRANPSGSHAAVKGGTMVGSISSFNAVNYAATAGLNRPSTTSDSSLASAASNKSSAADTFMAYMKKSPAERMIENWLKAHGLDEEKLKAMSPEERDSIMKQMKQEIEDQLKQQAETKGSVVDLTA
jgi:hypothetical protein